MTEPGSEPERTTGMPRWVKVFLIVAFLLVVAFVVTKLAGVEHGPGLHGP
jgi:hypothetical protein